MVCNFAKVLNFGKVIFKFNYNLNTLSGVFFYL